MSLNFSIGILYQNLTITAVNNSNFYRHNYQMVDLFLLRQIYLNLGSASQQHHLK